MADDDSLILEDEHGRIALTMNPKYKELSVAQLVTGLVVGVEGEQLDNGEFQVSHFHLPEIPRHPSPARQLQAIPSGKYIAFVSGLNVGALETEPLMAQLLADYLGGLLGGPGDHAFSAAVTSLVIAGNSIVSRNKKEKNRKSVETALEDLDRLLAQLAASINVELLPGESDPANMKLPQQPLLASFFPRAKQWPSFHRHTNPCELDINAYRVIGSSGQPINDMAKYASGSPLELLELSLRCRNVAPTAPDTLGCYPFESSDPFVLTGCPHIYFAGNQPSFSSKIITGSESQRVLLLCLPAFSKTGTVAFVELESLEVHVMALDVSSLDS